MSSINLGAAVSNIQAAREALARPVNSMTSGRSGNPASFTNLSNTLRGASLKLLGANSKGVEMFSLGKGSQNFGVLQRLEGNRLQGIINVNGLNKQFNIKLSEAGTGIIGSISGSGQAAGSFDLKNGLQLDKLSTAITAQGSINEKYYRQFGKNGPIIYGSINGNGKASVNYNLENGLTGNIDGKLLANGGITSFQRDIEGKLGDNTTYKGYVKGPSLYGVAGVGAGGIFAGVNATGLEAAGRIDYKKGNIKAYGEGKIKIADLKLGADGTKVDFKYSPIVASLEGGITHSNAGVDSTIGGKIDVGESAKTSGKKANIDFINTDKDGDGLKERGVGFNLGLGMIDLEVRVETELFDNVANKIDNVVDDVKGFAENFVQNVEEKTEEAVDSIF